MRKWLAIAALTVALSGCGAVDSMKEGFQHSQEVATDLEKAVGHKPFVGFNWRNGSLVNVSVTFNGIPLQKSNEEIVALARTSIAARFRQRPEQIVISYAVAGSGQ